MPLNSRYKRRLLARRVDEQNGRCCYCKRPFTSDGSARATLEHRKAKMDGGNDHVANLSAACLHCNRHRGMQMNKARQQARSRVVEAPGSPED